MKQETTTEGEQTEQNKKDRQRETQHNIQQERETERKIIQTDITKDSCK